METAWLTAPASLAAGAPLWAAVPAPAPSPPGEQQGTGFEELFLTISWGEPSGHGVETEHDDDPGQSQGIGQAPFNPMLLNPAVIATKADPQFAPDIAPEGEIAGETRLDSAAPVEPPFEPMAEPGGTPAGMLQRLPKDHTVGTAPGAPAPIQPALEFPPPPVAPLSHSQPAPPSSPESNQLPAGAQSELAARAGAGEPAAIGGPVEAAPESAARPRSLETSPAAPPKVFDFRVELAPRDPHPIAPAEDIPAVAGCWADRRPVASAFPTPVHSASAPLAGYGVGAWKAFEESRLRLAGASGASRPPAAELGVGLAQPAAAPQSNPDATRPAAPAHDVRMPDADVKQAPAPGSLTSVRVELASEDDRVRLHLRERQGSVDVEVRCSASGLREQLRGGLRELGFEPLIDQLEKAGYRSGDWRVASEDSRLERRRDEEPLFAAHSAHDRPPDGESRRRRRDAWDGGWEPRPGAGRTHGRVPSWREAWEKQGGR